MRLVIGRGEGVERYTETRAGRGIDNDMRGHFRKVSPYPFREKNVFPRGNSLFLKLTIQEKLMLTSIDGWCIMAWKGVIL